MKKYIYVSDCACGDVLAENVVNKYGLILAVKNTILNEYIREKITGLGVQRIWVYRHSKKDSKGSSTNSFAEFKKRYELNIIAVKKAINRLAMGMGLDIDIINEAADSLYSELKNNSCIGRYLNEIRSVDEYTYTHSINVAFYSMLIGKWMELSETKVKDIVKAGLLHDVGKTRIPTGILNKAEELSAEEFDEIKKHTIYGYDIVKDIDSLSDDIKKSVLMHHEREDGSGYPYGTQGCEINMYSKIVAIADVYDAVISDRVYRKRVPPFEAFEMFETAGVSLFDERIMRTFLSNLAVQYIGSNVLLDNGMTGEVIYVPLYSITKPVIKVGSSYIDLSKSSIKVLAML